MGKRKDVVIEAVKQDGNDLEIADEALRREKDVVLEAILQTPEAIKFAG